MIIELFYNCQDCGDGSVNVRFYKTEQQAIDAEEYEIENGGNGWGESSVGRIKLKLDSNGNISNKTYYEKYPNWREEHEPKDLSLDIKV